MVVNGPSCAAILKDTSGTVLVICHGCLLVLSYRGFRAIDREFTFFDAICIADLPPYPIIQVVSQDKRRYCHIRERDLVRRCFGD